MDSKTYIELAKTTESTDFAPIRDRLCQERMMRILHSTMGVATEAGELLDAVKKHVYYGKDFDEVNIREEVGDVFWYLAILADELGFDFESVMQKNIEKLRARYQGGFTEKAAINRDLIKEQEILADSAKH